MKSNKRIGERIKVMRLSRGLTQDEVGAQLGVSRSAVSFWEHGQRELTMEVINGLADVFNVRPSSIIEDENPGEDDEIWDLRETLRKNPNMRMLFSTAKNAKPEHIKAAAAMLNALKGNVDDLQ